MLAVNEAMAYMSQKVQGGELGLNDVLATDIVLTIRQRLFAEAEAKELAVRDFACTFLGLISSANGTLIMQIGDGGVVVDLGHGLQLPLTPMVGEYAMEAIAQIKEAQSAVAAAQALLEQRQSETRAAQSLVNQRQAELDSVAKRHTRSRSLAQRGAISAQQLDDDRAAAESARAALESAKAQVSASKAAIEAARTNIIQAQTRVEAAQATERRIAADIDDSELKAPRDGRVQYRVAEPGEVLAAGGRVLNMVDLSDVYMTFFLPTEQAGTLKLGGEARLILDAAPDLRIPATISFVASVAQFTPKTVETSDERLKLMFRVKARIPPELLQQHLEYVKTGLPGVAWVRVNEELPWPDDLVVRLPQ